MIPIIIFGGGALADEAAVYLNSRYINKHRYDDRYPDGNRHRISKQNITQLVKEHGTVNYITAIGDWKIRQQLVQCAEELKLVPINLIADHGGYYGETLGQGTIVAPFALIGIRSRVGQHCIINYHACVTHDCELGDFVNISPNATLCGGTKVKSCAYVGANAVVRDRHITIGERAVVGCGAVVLEDVPDDTVVAGVPAKKIRQN